MWNANLARISGALVFSLAAHTLLLGLAVQPGQGPMRQPARNSVEMRLTARPVPVSRHREASVPPAPPKVRELPAKPKPPKPLEPPPPVEPVAVQVRELPTPVVSEARESPEPEQVVEPSAAPAAFSATAIGGDAEPESSATGAESGDDGLVQAIPLYRDNPPPVYPGLARRRQWQGTVVLEVLVSEDGQVAELSVHQGSGYTVLDEAALTAVRNWRFTPGRKGENPVAMKVLVPVKFALK